MKTLLLILLSSHPVWAAENDYIQVGEARSRKTIMAIPEIHSKGDAQSLALTRSITEILNQDLNFMALFNLLDPKSFIENPKTSGISIGTFNFSDWSSIGADFLVKASLDVIGNSISLTAYIFNVKAAGQIFAKRYTANPSDVRTLSHVYANDIVKALTGNSTGIFQTKIAMVCDRGGKKKEIYIMDFDGTNIKQITFHGSVSLSPAWSPNGKSLVYSVFARNRSNIKNIDLYEFDFTSSSIKLLSNRHGINSGAFYSPDGNRIALTMSFLGNPDIFVLDKASQNVARLTNSPGVDVDPAFSPDGKKIVFVSSRSGKPMVYSMDSDGTNQTRLTYAGIYNATPSWSPKNNKIAFAGWMDGRFDIFIMNPDGTHIERLTKNQGNNEDPYFSPDGNFVVFSSNRAGQANVYAMNIDGTFVRRLTFGLGNCTTPKWSNPP